MDSDHKRSDTRAQVCFMHELVDPLAGIEAKAFVRYTPPAKPEPDEGPPRPAPLHRPCPCR